MRISMIARPGLGNDRPRQSGCDAIDVQSRGMSTIRSDDDGLR